MFWEVGLEVDVAGLKLGDILENPSKEYFGTLEFILLLDVFGLVVEFDGFVLLKD
jgi:hypothetical protein